LYIFTYKDKKEFTAIFFFQVYTRYQQKISSIYTFQDRYGKAELFFLILELLKNWLYKK